MDAPDSAKKIVRVNIFNQAYTVTTSGEPNDTEALAHQIDELMTSIARRAGNLDSTRTAVLACLHLADRLQTAERALSTLQLSVDSKTRNFSLMLDRVFEGGQE